MFFHGGWQGDPDATTTTVKPDATPEEVQAVVEDPEGGSQIFSQAVSDMVT